MEQIVLKIDVWCYNKLSNVQIAELLKSNYGIFLKAESAENGSHEYWFEKNQSHCFGMGSNWQDQDDQISYTFDKLVDYLHERMQSERSCITIHYSYTFE